MNWFSKLFMQTKPLQASPDISSTIVSSRVPTKYDVVEPYSLWLRIYGKEISTCYVYLPVLNDKKQYEWIEFRRT